MRKAVREFVKAYSIGATTAEFDELFALFVWSQGVEYFASEIGPSALFAAYKYVKTQEEKGIVRNEIVKELAAKFGEKNPDVGTLFKNSNNVFSEKSGPKLQGISETLLISAGARYPKNKRPNGIINHSKTVEILDAVGHDFSGKNT